MKKEQSVLNKLAKFSTKEVELSAQEPIEVELSLVNDIIDSSNSLLDIADETLGLKKSMKTDMRRLEGYQADGVELFRSLQRMQQELVAKLKDLDLQPNDSPQYKLVEKALASWSDANSFKI